MSNYILAQVLVQWIIITLKNIEHMFMGLSCDTYSYQTTNWPRSQKFCKNPIHLDVLDRCMRRMGDKWFPTRLFLIWIRTVRIIATRRYHDIFSLEYVFCVYWTIQITRNIQFMVDRYLRLWGFQTQRSLVLHRFYWAHNYIQLWLYEEVM